MNMILKTIIDNDKKYYMNTFGDRTKVCFTHGKGINLWDTNGKKYIDLFSGIAVNNIGHSHPTLVEAIKSQAEKFLHCSNLYYIENQANLAKIIVENSCADKVFFGNSGAEANEGALKLARIYFQKKGLEKYEVITLKNSFHGRTLATLSATGQDKYRDPYKPLMPSFITVPINDIEQLTNAITDKTCAIMLEPIQGESGVHPINKEYIKAVKDLCEKHNILLIYDEVQTGIGRTGKLFGYEHLGVEPDIFTLAKALGGGVPIGAVCAKAHIAEAFSVGDHGSTFGGNPLACAAGVAVMKVISDENIVENANHMGLYFKEKLECLSEKTNAIAEIRAIGLMIGVDLKAPKAKEIKEIALDKGFLIGNVGEYTLRILPPLIIDKQTIDTFIKFLEEVL